MNGTSPSLTPRSCGLAIWSLVLGILGIALCFLGPLFGIPAIICGHMALSRIKLAGGGLTGNGQAIAGLVMGYITIAMIPVIALLTAIAIPNFVKARQVAQRNGCINNLRVIDAAKQQWALENGKEAGVVPTLADLTPFFPGSGALPQCPAGGQYEIQSIGESPTCTLPEHELSY